MTNQTQPIFTGDSQFRQTKQEISGEFVDLYGEKYYKIRSFDHMQPFFMSLVSSSNHWFFISSTGGLTAGRVNPDQALFPYYTEDKVIENFENTGSKTIFLVQRGTTTWLWEPFSIRQQGQYDIQRNLYKNLLGSSLIFEEINSDLELVFRYAWRTSDRFGFIKTSWLSNSGSRCQVKLIDGIQNILPADTQEIVQNLRSCLLDAYKRNQLDARTGLALFALNSKLTDLAEPSESLLATTVFQIGLENPDYLLSSHQLDLFRAGQAIEQELETRGRRGAFFSYDQLLLLPKKEVSWHIVADVSQNFAEIINKELMLKKRDKLLIKKIEGDIEQTNTTLREIVAKADGLQLSKQKPCSTHHFANVLFNVMRGGVFSNQYWVDKSDFIRFTEEHNKNLIRLQEKFYSALPEKIHLSNLYKQAELSDCNDLIRLSYSYLPLFFSRRHGDPSRPWNKFSIKIKNNDGSNRLNYEGNWRDIFQNWEALGYAFPEFVEGMIFTFLNATTVDGYNPYRITRSGIEWEVPEPDNPWSNIGYWSDHQIIYLLKLMELSKKVHPGELSRKLDQHIFSYANVPYRIKSYAEIIKDPYTTIIFDEELDKQIASSVKKDGSDKKLVCDSSGNVLHRSLLEKLISLLLAKLVNFVPQGGIWMNTQRPEWNDANNALVGKGLSVVTLGYLYRYVSFFLDLISSEEDENFLVSGELVSLFTKVLDVLNKYKSKLDDKFTDLEKYDILTSLAKAGSEFRDRFYTNGLSGKLLPINGSELIDFLNLTKKYLEHSLAANKRKDHLYNAYNTIGFFGNRLNISSLDLMLEGQVSILSSGLLSGQEALQLIDSLQKSDLYIRDQNSFLLYPEKEIPGFLEKNHISAEKVQGLRLPKILIDHHDSNLLVQDELGDYHFSGIIHNEKDVREALEVLRKQAVFEKIVEEEGMKIVDLFESIFHHTAFTGRSSTFFAYEGLGSVYWHMVSKLLLAVQETILRCSNAAVRGKLLKKYREIRSGLGFNKTPAAFGAFPTDPYSHTPKGQGARQPGMSGVVKEEIITRLVELGLTIKNGCLIFNPLFVDQSELLNNSSEFTYIDINGIEQEIVLEPNTLAYTYCQTPIVLQPAEKSEIRVFYTNGKSETLSGISLDETKSSHIHLRDGKIQQILVRYIPAG